MPDILSGSVCHLCGNTTDFSAGNPLQWPLDLPSDDGSGRIDNYCTGCVVKVVNAYCTLVESGLLQILETIRVNAMNATPGPWHAGHLPGPDPAGSAGKRQCAYVLSDKYAGGIAAVLVKRRTSGRNDGLSLKEAIANVKHIALVDPTTVIRLCDVLLQREKGR